MKGNSIWAAVVLVGLVLTAVVTLTALGKDTTTLVSLISTIIVPILGAMIYGEVRAVREQTNGHTGQIIAMAEKAVTPAQPTPEAGPSTVDHTDGTDPKTLTQ